MSNARTFASPGTSPGAVHSPGLIRSEPVEMAARDHGFREGDRVVNGRGEQGTITNAGKFVVSVKWDGRPLQDHMTTDDLRGTDIRKMSAHAFAVGFLIDGEGPPASLAEMERDNAGDTALIARLRSMKPGDVYRAGGGAAAGMEIKAVQMSATPSAHALARAIHEARTMSIPVEDTAGFPASCRDMDGNPIQIGRRMQTWMGTQGKPGPVTGTVTRVAQDPSDGRWWVQFRTDDGRIDRVTADKVDMV